MAAWQAAGRELKHISQLSVNELHEKLTQSPHEIQVVDVRNAAEWEAGHIQDAIWRPLAHLAASLDGLERNRPLAVHCKSGYRSAIAASILARAGFTNVWNVTGGFDAWKAQNLPLVMPKEAESLTRLRA